MKCGPEMWQFEGGTGCTSDRIEAVRTGCDDADARHRGLGLDDTEAATEGQGAHRRRHQNMLLGSNRTINSFQTA